MDAVSVMLRFGDGLAAMCLAAAWAQKKAPVVLTSMVLRHWSSVMEMAGTQPTIPAKQNMWSREPRVETVEETPSCTEAESVTSTAMLKTRVLGNSDARDVMVEREERRVLSRSQRQIPEAPCSRRARAQERPRVPAPPVTGRFGQLLCR
jgi:hypothetical protein